jgi:hypothetical protein
MEFGKRRRAGSKKACKMSKKQAMTAFKKFFMKYCKRGSRFGSDMTMPAGYTKVIPGGYKQFVPGGFNNLSSEGQAAWKAGDKNYKMATAANLNYAQMQQNMMNQSAMPIAVKGSGVMSFGRRSRFGNGGNPPLYQSMGGEFCPSGMGGILGAFGTGLNPTPCTQFSASQAAAEAAASLPNYSSAKFGRRRRAGRPRKASSRRRSRSPARRRARSPARRRSRRS